MSQASASPAAESATACQALRSATVGSTSLVSASSQYRTTSSAKPESHVVYASHLNQCSCSGSRGGATLYFCEW